MASPAAVDHRRALVSSCIANVVEWYDFAVFGALAGVVGTVLLPPAAGDSAPVLIFAVFATSFVARPLGALLAGLRADQKGRHHVLVAMLILMAGATGAIGLLPTWAAIGVMAAVILVILRLLQGFSAGGQVSASITFLTEFAPAGRRGLYGGWHTGTVALGLASGLSAAAVTTSVLAPAQLERWGWRIPFLAALPLGLIALYIRRRLTESPAFPPHFDRAVTRNQLAVVWTHHKAAAITGFFLAAALSGAFNLWFVFLPTYFARRGVHSLSTALACGLAGLIAAAIVAPLAGHLSDRVGRRSVLVVALVALCVVPLPMYVLAIDGSIVGLVTADAVIGITLAGLVLPAYLSECFPVAVRATGLALTFGLATALIGGTAPLVAAALDSRDLPNATPFYLTGLAIAGLVSMAKAPRIQWAADARSSLADAS